MDTKFEWTQKMSVTDNTIDEQHKQLLNQLNVLLEATIERKNKETIDETVVFLSKYIEDHLKYEEEYLAKHKYPNLEEHKEAHHYFEKKYEEFKKKIKETGPSDSMLLEVESFLGKWWIEHIEHEDKKYADFIENNEFPNSM